MNEIILLCMLTHLIIMWMIEKEKEKDRWSNYAESSIELVGGNGLTKSACLFIRFEFFVCKWHGAGRQSSKIETRNQKQKSPRQIARFTRVFE